MLKKSVNDLIAKNVRRRFGSVLVTGGTGFLGSFIVHQLVQIVSCVCVLRFCSQFCFIFAWNMLNRLEFRTECFQLFFYGCRKYAICEKR